MISSTRHTSTRSTASHQPAHGRIASPPPMPRVLIVERDRMARLGLSLVLGRADQIEVVGAVGMVQKAEYRPASIHVDVVLIVEDVPDMDGMDGMDGISRLMTRFVSARVVVLWECQSELAPG